MGYRNRTRTVQQPNTVIALELRKVKLCHDQRPVVVWIQEEKKY